MTFSRTDRAVRQAFEAALNLMIQSFEQAANGKAETRRANALAITALCVGGMVLSRSIDDCKLADELRGAAKATHSLLRTGRQPASLDIFLRIDHRHAAHSRLALHGSHVVPRAVEVELAG